MRNDGPDDVPAWRDGVDLDHVELALEESRPLLDAVAATGAFMLIKVDGERTEGVDPRIFTVAISSGTGDDAGSSRFDDADLGRAVRRAVEWFDTRH